MQYAIYDEIRCCCCCRGAMGLMDCWTGGLDCGNAGRGPLRRGMVETEREKMCIRRQTRDCRTGEGKKGRKFFFVSFFISVSLFDSFQNEMRTKSECGVVYHVRSFCVSLFLAGRLKFFHSLFVFCVFAFVFVCVRLNFSSPSEAGGSTRNRTKKEKKLSE